MKQTNLRRAVNLTALVLAAGLLMGLLTGCFGLISPKQHKPELESWKITITVKGDENVIVNEPKTFEVAKGTKWSEVKLKVKVSYKDGYKEKGWKFNGESGYYLYDNYDFYSNETVFAISKKIPQPNDPDLFKTDGNGVITGYTCDEEDLPKALIIPAKIGNEVITGISDGAFKGCTGLTSIDLSGCTSLTEIGGDAFKGCTGLTSIDLSGCTSLTKIGRSAFSGCTGLTSLDLSACTSLTEIGWNAFSGCSNLTGTIVFPASLKTIESYTGFFYDSVGAFQSCTKLQGADFSACTSLTTIGSDAFKDCKGLTEVKLPASLTEIRWSAFKNCPIETLHIGCDIKGTIIDNLTHEASVVEHLKNIKLGEGVRTIDGSAFKDCKGLTEVKLPASLTYIGGFSGCTGLTNIDLSGCTSLTKIGSSAFEGCTRLTSIDLSVCTSLIEIGREAFSGCTGLTEVKLPASLTEIGEKAFFYCSNLAGTIVFPASLKTIKSYRGGSYPYDYYVGAFQGCTKLQGADFSACTNFTHIENSTFSGCTDLTEVKLPASLTKIGAATFSGCTGLTEVKLPASLTEIGGDAFNGCTGLTSIDLSGCTSLTEIGGDAFYDCKGLTEVKLPASLTTIGTGAFSGCIGLTEVKLPASLTTIGTGAFSGCTGLTEVKLPASLTYISRHAFYGCTNLTFADFANITGWAVYYDYMYNTKYRNIYSTDFYNHKQAAKYLREETDNGGYCDKYWKKN